MRTQRKFKNFLIKRKLQLVISVKYLVVLLMYSLVMGIMFFWIVWPEVLDYVPYTLINQIRQKMILSITLCSLPLLLIISVCCIIITHKIAGPLHQIEKKLDSLLLGEDAGLIKLRKGDELKELSDKLNKLLFKDRC